MTASPSPPAAELIAPLPLPRLLVSVQNAAEARDALRGGASVIDVKDPSQGSLGAAQPTTWHAVADEIQSVSPEIPLTLALGELRQWSLATNGPLPARVTAVKWGSSGYASAQTYFDDLQQARTQLHQHRSPVRCIPVAYADASRAAAPAWPEMLNEASRRQADWILLDTFSKGTEHLFDWISQSDLQAAIQGFSNLQIVLAGSLSEHLISQALACRPALLGVRGAVCEGQRSGKLCQRKVATLAQKCRDFWQSPIRLGT